jgi:hypothetical protein
MSSERASSLHSAHTIALTLSPTAIAGVRSATPAFDPIPKLHMIDELMAAAQARNSDWVRRALVQIVPEVAACGSLQAGNEREREQLALTRGKKLRITDQKRRSRNYPILAVEAP